MANNNGNGKSLESWIWDAACSIRGAKDAPKYKDYKSFCAIPQVLAFLKDYIVFAEKDEELNKYILRQHQTGAVDAAVSRALDPKRTRGLM